MDALAKKTKDLLKNSPTEEKLKLFLLSCVHNAPELSEDLQFVNCDPFSIQSCAGSYVLIDFFTYCCINCMHIMPYLHKIEEEIKPEDGLIVLGVHSGKFMTEKNRDNILLAIKRFGLNHPVINDDNYETWNTFEVVCWPTLVLINPKGRVVFVNIGESDIEEFLEMVRLTLRIDPPSNGKEIVLVDPTIGKKKKKFGLKSKVNLQFPGKVCYCKETNTIFVSDTGNHRILEVNVLGEVINKYEDLGLQSPQGLAVYNGELYICDTFNHQIVKVPLIGKKRLTIVCGKGKQGFDLVGGAIGKEQEISSPWDILIINMDSFSGCHGDLMLICMAGTHQIWGYALSDVTLCHKTFVVMATCDAIKAGTTWTLIGNGTEGNKNNSYPQHVTLAQPSGITYDGNKFCYIADSESSTIRSVELPSFAVKNVAGGELDPSNLFGFGDIDAKGIAAKLQHPVGIESCNGKVYIADTYNHKLKRVTPDMRVVNTLREVTGLKEPSGVSADESRGVLYIADTNNHDIKTYHFHDKSVKEFKLLDKKIFARNLGVVTLAYRGSIMLNPTFKYKLNKEADSTIKAEFFTPDKKLEVVIPYHGKVVELQVPFSDCTGIQLILTVFNCAIEGPDEDACFKNECCYRINFHPSGQVTERVEVVLSE